MVMNDDVGWRRLVGTITAFTLAHSITLAAATLGFVSVPGPPVEAVITLSIVFMACEIVHHRQGRSGLTERWPWVVAFTFGLLHGFRFAGALHEVGLPQSAIPLALLLFNVGVELGQLLFIASVMAALTGAAFIGRSLSQLGIHPKPAYTASESAAAYAIGSVAAFWLIERTLGFLT
jgi:HupE/UreJ protein